MRIVAISDTHGRHARLQLPAGDVLVHAGDITARGELETIAAFAEWLAAQPHRHKVVIAGNHDFCFEDHRATEAQGLLAASGAHYLQDQRLELDGVVFYGSPWQPRFHDWAFNLDRGAPIATRWAAIPEDTGVLITHGPPMGQLDRVWNGQRVGCEALRDRIAALPALQAHVFGHIHEAYGERIDGGVRYVNASTCTLLYRPSHAPRCFEVVASG